VSLRPSTVRFVEARWRTLSHQVNAGEALTAPNKPANLRDPRGGPREAERRATGAPPPPRPHLLTATAEPPAAREPQPGTSRNQDSCPRWHCLRSSPSNRFWSWCSCERSRCGSEGSLLCRSMPMGARGREHPRPRRGARHDHAAKLISLAISQRAITPGRINPPVGRSGSRKPWPCGSIGTSACCGEDPDVRTPSGRDARNHPRGRLYVFRLQPGLSWSEAIPSHPLWPTYPLWLESDWRRRTAAHERLRSPAEYGRGNQAQLLPKCP